MESLSNSETSSSPFPWQEWAHCLPPWLGLPFVASALRSGALGPGFTNSPAFRSRRRQLHKAEKATPSPILWHSRPTLLFAFLKKAPHPGFLFLTIWKPGVQDQGAGRFGFS